MNLERYQVHAACYPISTPRVPSFHVIIIRSTRLNKGKTPTIEYESLVSLATKSTFSMDVPFDKKFKLIAACSSLAEARKTAKLFSANIHDVDGFTVSSQADGTPFPYMWSPKFKDYRTRATVKANTSYIARLNGATSAKADPVHDAPRQVDFNVPTADTSMSDVKDLPPLPTKLGIPDTEAAVCTDITERQRLGVKKYLTTLANNPLALRDWMQHKYEEQLDELLYTKRIIQELDKELDNNA